MPLLSIDLEHRPVPDWLARLALPELGALAGVPFPVADILRDSAYYPASHFHGFAPEWLGGAAHSFVYVDHGTSLAAAVDEARGRGFAGYRLAGLTEVREDQLAPRGWRPSVAIGPRDRAHGPTSQAPYAVWMVFDRNPDLTDEHGPSRFNLVHIGGDGVATYDALYRNNGVAPEFLCLIKPGNPDLWADDELLFRVVLDHGGAVPSYLVSDRFSPGHPSLWLNRYPVELEVRHNREGVRVWARGQHRSLAAHATASI